MKPLRTCTLAVLCVFLLIQAAAGTELSLPTGLPILTVRGMITRTNGPGTAAFDRAMLERIGRANIRTSTSWTDGEVEFEGVPLTSVLKTVGSRGSVVIAVAHNNYAAKITIAEAERYEALLAWRQNGETLRLRDKGPLWVVFPRDRHPDLKDKSFDVKWVWQVKELIIE